MKTKLFKSMNIIRCVSGANLNLFRYTAMVLVLLLGVGNAWAGHDQHTATLNVAKGTGNGSVYASTSATATSGSASASFNCGKSSDGQHTGTLYAYATPADGYTFLGWTTSASSSAGADNANPKGVAFDVTNGSSTQNLYAHFVEKAKVNITFEAPSNGTYTIAVNGGSAETVSSANVVKSNVTGVTLTATPASGYAFAGWYKLNSAGEFVEDLSIATPYDASFTTSETIKMGARFVPTTLGKFILKGSSTEYYGLKAATIAAGGSGTIVPVADETLVDGSDLMPFDNGTYSIKAGATLLIPYSSANEVQTKPKDIAYNTSGLTTALSIYKKLITREGVSINVMSGGVLCVGGQLVSYNGGNPSAYPIGACGVLDMSNGGHIELNGTIYCWGFIKGQDMDQGNNTVGVGSITANSGSVIWEDFAVGDWRGGSACSTIAGNASSWKFFPFQSYTIQNVEVPTTYHYGATLSNYTNVYGGGGKNEGTFSLIGKSNTLFQLKDASSSVCKWYDPTTDLVNYEMRGTAQLDALNVDAGITTVSSSSYNLPLSSNMQIVLAAGCNMTLSKPMVVQPGAVVEVKSGASLTLSSNTYIFDVDNWGMYCNGRYFYSMTILTSHKNRGTGKSKDLLDDAKLIVDGTLNVTGKIYATDGGANIMGNGAGSISLSSLGGNGNIVMCTGVSTNENVAIAQANLCNEDESYTKSIASTTFHNVNGRWFKSGNQNEKANHTYDFTYISSGAVSGTGGTNSTTDALYAPDKTGLTAGMKWCNVAQDATCSNIYNATQALNETPASDIRYTYPSDSWLQLLRTETEGVYGGSDNSLYAVEGCAVNSLGSVDENCLYTIGDVKKALVDGHFVALEKNTEDEAWHDVANPTNYYICFEGCNWHPATKYAGEEKAYIVEEGDYIWYNNDWLLVEREDPFFFDYNDQNVKRYYEYENDEWVLADPKVRVTDAIETREFFFLPEAITVASGKKNATITILKDISGINNEMTFTAANTTCTLDLNGHTVSGAVPFTDDNNRGLLKINASGTTFTITDNSANKEGRLENICNQNKVTYTVHLMAGTLNLNAGTIYAQNLHQYRYKKGASDNVTSMGTRAVQVAAAQRFNITGGRVEANGKYEVYGIVATGSAANQTVVDISGTGEVYAEGALNTYGIACGGKLNLKAGLVEAHLNSSWANSYNTEGSDTDKKAHATCRAITMSAKANATASSCYYGTLTVTGGTIKASTDAILALSYTSNVYGVYMSSNVAGLGNRNFASTSGTNAQQASSIGSIKNAEIIVDNKANYGYGISVYGHYNSYNNSNSVFKVENTTVDVKAYYYAYGIYACGDIDGTTGECYTGDVELTNCTVTAEATTADYAYATYVYAGQKTIYKDKQANYYGEYATAAKMTINSGTYTAKTKKSTAYAACTSTRAKTIYDPETSVETDITLGEGIEAYPTLIIKDGTFTAEATTTTARAVSSGGNTTITGGTFNATATKYYAYGIYAVSGTLEASDITVNATAKGRVSSSDNNAYAYGVFADCGIISSGNQAWTGYTYASDVTLNNCTVNATATTYNNARGLCVNARSALLTQANYEAQKTTSSWSAATWAAYQAVFPGDNTGRAIAARATVNGGTFTATAAKATAYGALSAQTALPANKEVTASPEMTLKNATFIATTGTGTTAYGVQAGGPTLIEGCTITATAGNSTKYQSTASGVRALDKTTIIKNSTITATATDAAYGLEGYVEINATHGYCWHGEFDLSEAGTTEVTAEAKTSGKKAWSVYLQATNKNIASGDFAGDYATAANATINGGTYKAIASGSGASAYCLSIAGKKTQGEVSAQPEVEVLDGFFNGATAEVGTAGVVGHMQLKGGYFVHPTNLATYVVAPKSVWTLPNTHEHYDPYKYKIAEVYTLAWSTDGDALTGTYSNGILEAGSAITAPATPTKPGHTFKAWSPAFTGTMPSANTTYTTTWNVNNHSLSWVTDGDALTGEYTRGTVAYGTTIAVPNTPTKANYVFNGWHNGTSIVTPASTMPDNDLTYTAQWAPAVASVTANELTTYHATVADAISAANDKNNAVVTMLQNASVASEVTISAAMTIDLNGKTVSSTQATASTGVFKISASGKTVTINGAGGTIKHTANASVFGIYVAAGSTLNMTGGTVEVDGGSGNPRGVYVRGSSSSKKATVNLTDVSVESKSTGNNSIAVYTYAYTDVTIHSGTYIATANSLSARYAAYARNETGSQITINGGKFNGQDKDVYKGGTTAKISISGGYYVHNTDLAVNCATNYHVLDLTGEDPYLYKVAEAYTITFKNGDNNTIQSGLVEEGTMPEYNGTTPTKTATEQYTYTFNGWDPAITEVTADATYTAQFSSTPRTYDVTLNTNGGTISSGNVESYTCGEVATLPTDVTREGYEFGGWYDNSGLNGDAVTTISKTATGDKKYWAKWSAIEYTITWLNWNGDPLKEPTITSTINYGNPPGYPLGGNNPAPTREASDGKTYEWDGWTTGANGAGSFYSIDNLPDATGDATYYAHFRITAIDVASTIDISIDEDAEVTTTTVRVEGKLNVPENRTLTTDDLILEGTPSSSGEILIDGDGTLTAEHAYFDFSNGASGFKARTWYAVAVPWQVDVKAYAVDNGVYIINGNAEPVRQKMGTTFDLIYYDGALRAEKGHSDNCWKYVEDDDQEKHIMYPGRAYMIYLTSDAQTIRFERKSGTDLITNTLAVYAFTLGTGNDKDANWNGIANPATYHAYINANVKNYSSGDLNVGQVYNAETRTYSLVNMNDNNLVVGQPIFVQVTATNESVVAYATREAAFHAPRRAKDQDAPMTRYEVMFAPNEGEVTDRIIVRMDDEKETDKYIVGQDLVKMGVSDIVPQMWVDRYDGKMCINTIAPVNNRADYPLGISVEKSGAYDIFIDDQPDDETMLYLTYDGEAIWNLSYGGYVANLEKGSNTHYGLRIVRSPKVTTGIEETTILNGDAVRKVVIEDKVFIIRNGQIFGIDGRLVK